MVHYTGEARVAESVQVSDYRLDDLAIKDWGSIPSRTKRIFPLACVQTGSGAHPALCLMRTGGPFPGHSMLLTTEHLGPRSRMSKAIHPLPQAHLHGT
jgi:hypothetical protein